MSTRLPPIAFLAIFTVLAVTNCLAAHYIAPIMPNAPTLDGSIDADEWQLSAGFDGFAMNGTLERRRVRANITATQSHLYIAVTSQLPAEGKLLSQVNLDTVKIVYDDSIEVWVDPAPGAEHGKVYQMLANPIGRTGYKAHVRGNVPEDPAWQGNWQVANGFHDGWWHCEVAVPINDIAPDRRAGQGTWGINVCRNWKRPWQFSSLGGGVYMPGDAIFSFAKSAPAITHTTQADPFTGDIDMALAIHNPAEHPLHANAAIEITRDAMPALRREQTLTVRPGQQKLLRLQTQDQSTQRFQLTIRVTEADGEGAWYARSYNWERAKHWQWTIETEPPPPIDFQFAYYPYLDTMRVRADITNLPEDAEVERLICTVRQKGAGNAIKTIVFDDFTAGRQEKTFALPPLEGEYEIAMTPHGTNVPEGELVKGFERTVYPWEHAGLGKTDKVYPPFTPLRVDGDRVRTVLRDHTINEFGLWDQVIAKGKPVLAEPMRFAARVDGAAVELNAGPLEFVSTADTKALAETSLSGPGVNAEIHCTWDYDGCMRLDMELMPSADHSLDALTLEIPLDASEQLLYHAMADGIRNTLYEKVPAGQGVVWTSERVQAVELPANFCSYIYVGTPVRGLCWFAENDRGWSWDPTTPNVEILRRGDIATLRIHLVNEPIAIRQPRRITFGLLAAPVKPRLGDWRYKWNRDNYTLLGTDINWFALGNCGAVYPAHKDMHLWRMLARANAEELSSEEIEHVVEYGRKYWEPYGEGAVERYERHVRYNLRARRNKKMVLYYNRASYQRADEFQTFKDEWCLTDYRTIGEGNGIGEIKIVPTESYIDHALYWYGKAFDVANSKGVYWDNYFFCATYNQMMQSAYERDDGTIMPSTGLWGLRELAKRTFQYMNERHMLPVTMAHMTSTGILPLLSFCTVQYDWEWKYSRGDVQYRFPREYILLVSNGELAGTWPVLLQDHGKLARDPWTQRTFAGVCIVHELTGWGLPEVWRPLLQPIYDMLDSDQLQVYRYWDERPQPITTDSEDLPTIVYSIPGQRAIFAVTSYAEGDMQARITIDPAPLGFDGEYRVFDVETDEEMQVTDDTISLPIKKHNVREFGIVPAGDRG